MQESPTKGGSAGCKHGGATWQEGHFEQSRNDAEPWSAQRWCHSSTTTATSICRSCSSSSRFATTISGICCPRYVQVVGGGWHYKARIFILLQQFYFPKSNLKDSLPPSRGYLVEWVLFNFLSFISGGYGKLIGAGDPRISSHRYSPYPLPSLNANSMGALTAQLSSAGGVQYTMTSPLMSQALTAPAVLSPSSTNPTPAAPAAHHQTQLDALQSPATPSPQGTNLAAAPGVPGLAMNPYQAYNLANVAGVDWSSLGYTLPAMYTL